MICPHCEGENSEGKKFCKHCGQSLIIQEVEKNICPACHIENLATAKFCKGCGTSLAKENTHAENVTSVSEQEISVPRKLPIARLAIAVTIIALVSASGVMYYNHISSNDASSKQSSANSAKSLENNGTVNHSQPVDNVLPESSAPTETILTDGKIDVENNHQIANDTDQKISNVHVSTQVKLTDSEYIAIKANNPQYAKADKQLNQAFSTLYKSLSDADKQQLKNDQNQWIVSRDKIAYSTGQKSSNSYAQSLIDQSHKREEVLRKRYLSNQNDAYLDEQMTQLESFSKGK